MNVTLRSSDREEFVIDGPAARRLKTIESMFEPDRADNVIPLPKVTSRILSKVIEYCNEHVNAVGGNPNSPIAEDDFRFRSFEADFVKVDRHTVYDLFRAANYLEIQSLLDLTCKKVGRITRKMTSDEIRQEFNIRDDLTPEDEEGFRSGNQYTLEEH